MLLLRQLLKHGARNALLLVLWLAGCDSPGGQNAYGIITPPHDPTVELVDFSYAPASPIHLGDTLTFSAKLNHRDRWANMDVAVGETTRHQAYLRDDGIAPDPQADDGIYTGQLIWEPTFGTAVSQPVQLRLFWYDGSQDVLRNAAPLTVVE